MSTPPSRKKPTLLANLILLGLIVVVLGGVLGGGWWAVNRFVLAEKKPQPAPPSPAQTPSKPTTPSTPGTPASKSGDKPSVASTTPTTPKADTVPPLVNVTPEPPATTPPVVPSTPGSAKPGPSADKPIASIPSTPPGPGAPQAVAPTDPNVVAATPNTPAPLPPPGVKNPSDVVPLDPLPADDVPPQKEEPIAVFDEESPEVKALKDDADRRINEAPPDLYPDREKSRVRAALRGSKKLARVATLHFSSGSSSLGSREQTRLKNALLTDQASELMSDPEAALVCIGFADQTGDPGRNKEISKQRAMNVISVLKKQGVTNVTYPVAIGGTEVVAPGNKDKNRAVEVWLVLP